MKKIIISLAALSALTIPLTATAADNSFYIRGSGGIAMAMDTDVDNMIGHGGTAKVTYDSGWAATFAAGYDFLGPLRADVEYLWQKNDVDTLMYKNEYGNFTEGDFKLQAFMFNGYYDVQTNSPWTPYVGGGIGWAKLDLNTPGLPTSDYDDTLAYQVMGGVAYAVTSQLSLDAQYRFTGTGDASIKGADYSMHSNNVMVGVGYSF